MPSLVSITVTPNPASMPDDGLVQFTATGHYDDSSTRDITAGDPISGAETAWNSTDMTVAYVNAAFWPTNNPGLAMGVAPGTSTIFANCAPGAISPISGSATVTVTAATPPGPPPDGRLLVAFDDATLEPYPTWTRLDDHPNLVTSYSIDRGRGSELDRFDSGRATVQIADPDGVLDITNPGGPYYGQLRPLMQAMIGRQDPVTGDWNTRFRGYIEDFTYQVDPSQKVNRLQVSLVDMFEILSAAELQPEQFGVKYPTPRPPETLGQIYFTPETPFDRITGVLRDFGLAGRLQVVMDGNVNLQKVTYSPGEPVLSVLQETVDAEFPAVATLFCDRRGRLVFHDRQARFDPAATSAALPAGAWDYHHWKAGDGAAVAGSIGDTVQLRAFGWNRGLGQLVNSAASWPANTPDDLTVGQMVIDPTSIGRYGIRSWSATDLLTGYSPLDDLDGLPETLRFANYVVANYADPVDRISEIQFRPLRPTDPRAPALWEFLNQVDIGDSIEFAVATPGGGGFTTEQFFVEGVHEQVSPLQPGFDNVTLSLDLSPKNLFLAAASNGNGSG